MQNTKALNALFAASLSLMSALILPSCSSLSGIVSKPTVDFYDVKVAEPTLVGATLNFVFQVNNPNAVSLRLGKINYALDINTKRFTSGSLATGLRIPANDKAFVTIPLRVNYLELVTSLADLFQHRDATYKITGDVDAGPVTLPFSKTGSFELPRLPSMGIKDIRMHGINQFVMDLEFDNPNSFIVPLKGLDYDLDLGGHSVAEGQAPLKGLSAAGKTVLQIPVQLSLTELASGVRALLSDSSTPYRVRAALKVPQPLGAPPASVELVNAGRAPVSR